jgi:hypothetical protein
MDLTTKERGRLHRVFVVEWQEWFDVDPQSGCWLWKRSKHWKGYGLVSLKSKTLRAHRLAYAFHVGPIPEGEHVLHSCDVRNCVNPLHLFVGTNQDNVSDKIAKGRNGRKLSVEQVRQIRRDRVELGLSSAKLGKAYSVSTRAIQKILSRENWARLS